MVVCCLQKSSATTAAANSTTVATAEPGLGHVASSRTQAHQLVQKWESQAGQCAAVQLIGCPERGNTVKVEQDRHKIDTHHVARAAMAKASALHLSPQ